MGNVSGKFEDGPTLFLRDQARLSIAALQITNLQGRVLLKIVPNAFPSAKVSARKEAGDDSLVEFVQDPDPTSLTPLLLKISNEDELFFNFTFIVRQKDDGNGALVDTALNGLTFVSASNPRELENLVTREFHADPNLHKNPNVNLVGNYSTNGSNAVQFEWRWRWRPPRETQERSNSGWRNTCSFLEYDQRAHKLSTLAQFSFWIQNTPRVWPPSPSIGPEYNLTQPPKIRMSSVDAKTDDGDPPSPSIDNFDGSTLGPSITNAPSVKVDNCPRPGDNNMTEDGPLFRATIKSLEQKTTSLRGKMKKVIKRAEQARQAQSSCNDAFSAFMESLRDAATSGNASGIKPALDHYFERTYKEILYFERQNEVHLQRLIIEPLTTLYNVDLKRAEAKKRDFEDESRDYYSYVGRYLGIRQDTAKEKKKAESETKYQTKRKNFELKRFDYTAFMQDLHGGRKEQEVLCQLTAFADAQAKTYLQTAKKVQELLPELEALNHEVRESGKEFQLQRTEREERRRLLENSNNSYVTPDLAALSLTSPTTPQPTSATPSEILGHHIGFERLGPGTTSNRAVSSGSEGGPESHGLLPVSGLGSAPATSPGPSPNKFRGIRDLSERDYTITTDTEGERRKEGLLWALSRPGSHVDPKGLNKQAWHKYWIVLAGGQLCEYSNWKQKLDLHNEPINLKMATVREARNVERRFCFEVVTPQYKRIYQATSEEDMQTWISAINNAVKSTIESGGSIKDFDLSPIEAEPEPPQQKNIASALTGKSPHYHHSVHGTNPMSAANQAASGINRRTTVGARPSQRRNSSNFADSPEKLLQMVREADPSNTSCADCSSQVKAEWVSINLGIVLCIECSGLHRSLGTHISKVRSLTLDVTSFTPDLIELLLQVGNRRSNAVWEARMDPAQRPDARSSREARLKFITAKYVARTYVQPLSPTLSTYASPDDALLSAVRRNDLEATLYSLALKANPNLIDPGTRTPALFLALVSADPPSPVSAETRRDPLSPTETASPPPTTFPLAELLLQNGGEVPFPLPLAGLTPAAKSYLAQKTAKHMGEGTPMTSAVADKEREQREKERKEKERLQKRVSSGARLHRAPPLPPKP